MDSNKNFSAITKAKENKQLLFMFALARKDISLVKNFKKNLTEAKSKDINDKEANTISLYIIYGRIFSKNLGLPKLSIDKIKCALTEDEKTLHNGMIHLRDKIFAHNDPIENTVRITMDDGKLVAITQHLTSLIDPWKELADQLFDKIHNSLNQRIDELIKELYQDNVNKGEKVTLGYSNELWERRETF